MGLFSSEPAICTICKKPTKHKHKAKKEWYVESPLCGDCYISKMQEQYDGNVKSFCDTCKMKKKVSELWEPRWQWDMKGLLCKTCFDKKENDFNQKKEFCSQCSVKLGFFRYKPKPDWKMDGQLCRNCWDSIKAKNG